jgi:hypothetical protein
MRDERAHSHAASDRVGQRLTKIGAVEAEHHDVHRLPGAADGREQRCHAVIWLNDQLHAEASGRRPEEIRDTSRRI